jgi:hypothetical protein
MEYYSAIKRNELLIHTTWVDLKGIALNGEKKTISKGHMKGPGVVVYACYLSYGRQRLGGW